MCLMVQKALYVFGSSPPLPCMLVPSSVVEKEMQRKTGEHTVV